MQRLTRFGAVAALVAGLALAGSGAATAVHTEGHWGVGGGQTTPPRAGDPPRGGPATDRAPRYPHYSVEHRPGGAENGDNCWALGVEWRDEPQRESASRAARENYDFYVTNDRGIGACPGPGIDLPALAREYWLEAIPVPAAPKVDPEHGLLTGLPAYLVLEGERTIDVSLDPFPGISLWIRGEATYIIDWGDGAVTTTTSQGVPYPGGPGEITHTYRDVPAGGTVTITVTARWTGTSSAGPLPTIDRVSSVTVPIDQVQATRDR